MPEIDLVDIIVDEFSFPEETIQPIRESIREQGLHHPLLVTPHLDPASPFIDHLYKLVAGKKRYLAMKQLNVKMAPVKILASGLTDDQVQEISLHENLKRDNVSWYEQVEMRLQLHLLNLKKRGVTPKRGGARGGGRPHRDGTPANQDIVKQGWTIEDTARELGIASGTLAQDMDLARAVALDPSLSKVKDKTTALKLIKGRAKRGEAEAFALIPSDFEMNQVFLGGAEEVLRQIPALTFNACITDPPWSQYARDEELIATQVDLLPIFREVFRVLKNDSFLFVITSSTDQPHYMQELPKIGFAVQQYPLIWYKDHTITHGRRSWEFARDYEPIIVAVKGNPILNSSTEISSILNYKNLHYTKMIHPHEKPIELLKQLVRNCSYAGSSILDPFAGSGVTLEAAKELGREYIGIEKDQKFYANIVRRLEGK